jgi:hypothetical protein
MFESFLRRIHSGSVQGELRDSSLGFVA